MSRTRAMRIVVFSVALASVAVTARVLASAPADQYESFVATDAIITDRQTRLTWERAGSPVTVATYANAISYCGGLGTSGGGWRLPSENELLTLVDEDPHQQYEDAGLVEKAVDPSAFPTTASAFYATQSPLIASGQPHIVVDFTTGVATLTPDTTPRYVRCVRPCTQNDAGACTP